MRYALFVCSHNAGRSQMAQALFERATPHRTSAPSRREEAAEFDGVRPEEEIRACADAILSDCQDVPVRSFLMTIAHRRARQCLRAETCDVLAAV